MNARWILFAALAVLLALLASCGGEEMTSTKDQKGTGGKISGILINAQNLKGDSADIMHKTIVDWRIVDPSGAILFQKSEIDPAFMKMRGVRYEFRRAEVMKGNSLDIGKHPKEIAVASYELIGEEKKQTAVMKLSAAQADELRSIPDWKKLMTRIHFVILVGKLGQ